MTPTASGAPALQTVRCAIYTRKSTEEGLDQEFNSLDAQREAAQAYIASQQHAGWRLVPDRYDDGGYTGGNMDRPALARLLGDIAAGRVDCVVVYKVDRLSRSLLDFAKMMEAFEQHQVAFVSITQQFNTATSIGRLVLHILLSFAQFEREIISERTRDKIAAARRKGKWAGGMPLLGYDVQPRGSTLVVNAAEAQRVRGIFALYLRHEGLVPMVKELKRRGWRNKRWRTRKGSWRGGKLFTRNSLHQLLTNVVYCGQIRYRQEVHPGEHPAIVDPSLWQQVQALLRVKRPRQRARLGNSALLQGRLRCARCGCAMLSSHTTKGSRCYRYYICSQAQKRGWKTCPAPSVHAGEIERLVGEQIQRLSAGCKDETRASWWQALPALAQVHVVQRLIERIDYDGVQGTVAICFAGDAAQVVAEQQTLQREETQA
jgi:site-specific DNA recombinase